MQKNGDERMYGIGAHRHLLKYKNRAIMTVYEF